MNNSIKIAEACGLVHVGYNDYENQNEYQGTKEAWKKTEKYWGMYENGEYDKIEKELNIEILDEN